MQLAEKSGSRCREAAAAPAQGPAPAPTPWSRFKRGCLHAFQAGLDSCGLASLYVRHRRVTGAAILSFHSVADDEQAPWIDPRYRLEPRRFERQMKFLAARRTPVSLTRLVEALEEGRELPPRTVVVTFDDGYLDHATVAGPILAKLGIPATFFIPTGGASRTENQWIDTLYSAFERRTRHELTLDGTPPRRFDLSRPSEARRAMNEMQTELLSASYRDRCEWLRSIEDQLRPNARTPRLMMDWNDVRSLQKLSPDFEIGGHTRNHVDLSARGAEDFREEIAGCAEDLRRELGDGSRHFCYPYERWTPESQEQVRIQGFRSGVGTGEDARVTKGSDRFALPRIDPAARVASFGFVTSGAYPDLSKALTGRA